MNASFTSKPISGEVKQEEELTNRLMVEKMMAVL